MRHSLAAVVFAVAVSAPASAAVLPPPLQVTPANDGLGQGWDGRNSPTSGGRILFVGSDDVVRLYNGSSIVTIQNSVDGEPVNTTVFALGAGSSGGVIGGWRRNGEPGYGNVSIDGGAASPVTLNPEGVAIRDGCTFMVLQTGAEGTGAHVFRITPSTGDRLKVSSGTFDQGANRAATSKCRVAWTFQPTNADPVQLGYWNGTETILEPNIESLPSFVSGKLVYTKVVSGVQQVFLIDTDISLTPVQVSNETDPNVTLHSPQTDGRHIAWYRFKTADGSNPRIVLRGGLTFPTPPLQKLHNVEAAFQLDTGQLLWKTAAGAFQYDDGLAQFDLDPSPATNAAVKFPWLSDGFIAFLATPTGGAHDEVFRVTGSVPLGQPQPPLVVSPLPGSAVVRFDEIIGATSYNAYVAYAPGVTKGNYASLAGGRKIENVTSGFTIPGIPKNTTYYVAITAIDNGMEGPSSRNGSTTFIGATTWRPLETGWPYYSVAADPVDERFIYAGSHGGVVYSWNRGRNFETTLLSTQTGASRIRAVALHNGRVFAATNSGDIWRYGLNWEKTHAGSSFSLYGGIAVDPADSNIVYAGNFETFSPSTESKIIKSGNGGDNWLHTAPGPSAPDEIEANALAAAATTPTTIYAGGNGTPNVAKTADGGQTWTSAQIPGGGEVRSLAVDPTNANVIYASTRDKGVFKSLDGGVTWDAKNNGLAGVSDDFFGGAEFNAILVDPQDPNLIHLGAGNGYWLSLDGGEHWLSANSGFASTPWIYGLAMAPTRWLFAATEGGLYTMSFASPPVVTAVDPPQGHVNGQTEVTIHGSGFEPSAAVYFGDNPAAASSVTSSTTIWAQTGPHAAGTVDVTVRNPDQQTGTLVDSFTYSELPDPPTVTARATSDTTIEVSWHARGATSYEVERRGPGETFIALGATASTSRIDTVASHTSYLYRVRAVNSAGASPYKADFATAMIFVDGNLAGLPVKAVHLAEARMAVDHMRALAGLGAAAYADPASPGVPIRAIHITEMRTAIDEALSALGFPTGGYGEGGNLAGLTIKAQHLQEIRSRAQ